MLLCSATAKRASSMVWRSFSRPAGASWIPPSSGPRACASAITAVRRVEWRRKTAARRDAGQGGRRRSTASNGRTCMPISTNRDDLRDSEYIEWMGDGFYSDRDKKVAFSRYVVRGSFVKQRDLRARQYAPVLALHVDAMARCLARKASGASRSDRHRPYGWTGPTRSPRPLCETEVTCRPNSDCALRTERNLSHSFLDPTAQNVCYSVSAIVHTPQCPVDLVVGFGSSSASTAT